MINEFVLTNATLIMPEEVLFGHILVRDGVIAEIGTGPYGGAALDLEGDFLAPGLLELHTDNLERHIRPRPRVDWPHDAAIIAHDAEMAGVGITTVFDAMRVGSILSNTRGEYRKYARALADEILNMQAKGALRVSHHLHLRAETCSETLIDELDEFTQQDHIGIVSIMDHTPGQRQFTDLAKFEAYVRGKHSMEAEAFQTHLQHLLALRSRVGATHEAATVAAAKRLGAVLASHDDTTQEQVNRSAGFGVKIAEFPTTIEAAQACHDHDISVVMGAPNLIRGGSHSGNVAAAELAQKGYLDIISSDYVPSALLLAAVRLGETWGNMARGLATVTQAPARAAGLTDRGQISVGLRADLVRFRVGNHVPIVRSVWVQGQRIS